MSNLSEILHKIHLSIASGSLSDFSNYYRQLFTLRNKLARDKGYADYVDMQSHRYGVSSDTWDVYFSQRNEFSKMYHPHLQHIIDHPHFLSQASDPEINYPNGIWSLVSDSTLQSKVNIKVDDHQARFIYHAETDSYNIYIPETNTNQRLSMLIHELGHVQYMEDRQKQIESSLESEIGAYQHELFVLNKLSHEFKVAAIREYLMCLVRLDFQIEMYKSDTIDIVDLYRKIMHRYVGELVLGNHTNFLMDDKLVLQPLSDIPAGIGLVLASLRTVER